MLGQGREVFLDGVMVSNLPANLDWDGNEVTISMKGFFVV